MGDGKFKEYYKKLNPAQKEAVDTIEGPVMVIAGPGTGKTQILTLRIANIIKQTDISPDSILALTFTTSGVYSMRRRLVEIIGSEGYRVKISTFHAFCNDVIRDYPEEFPLIIGARPATTADQIRLLKDIIVNTNLELLKPYGDTFYYLKPALSEIAKLKRENITPQALTHLAEESFGKLQSLPDLYHQSGAHQGKMRGQYKVEEKSIAKNKELAIIYGQYQEALRRERLYDFGDMILSVINQLEKNEDLLLRLQEEYQYVLADEHQDANGSQNRLLELLVNFHPSPNLFIVGDEKQAIFQFQGASLDNFDYFLKLYPSAKRINLINNYRSSQLILDSAHSVIGKSSLAENSLTKLKSALTLVDEPIKYRQFQSPEEEYLFLVESIKKRLTEGVSPDQIAVLYRNNADADLVVRLLDKFSVSVVVESDRDILTDREIAKLILLLRCIVNFGDEELLIKVLHLDLWSVDRLDLYKVLVFKRQAKVHLIDILRDQIKLKALNLSQPDYLIEAISKLETWAVFGENKNLTDTLEKIIAESGFMAYLLSLPDNLLALERLRTFFNEAKELTASNHQASLSDFINHLDILLEHKVAVNSNLTAVSGVRLMTAHKAKGLEFDYVYIIGLRDGHWGNKRSGKLFNIPLRSDQILTNSSLEDERRLFYVALTRARKEINVSFAIGDSDGRSYLPSVFLSEIDPSFIVELDGSVGTVEKNSTQEEIFKMTEKRGNRQAYQIFAQDLLEKQGLSVSGLNNYLECPWRYFFLNLLHIPKAKNKQAMYGTAVHAGLYQFFKQRAGGLKPVRADLLRFFVEALDREPLSEDDFSEAKAKGEHALGGYFDTYKESWIDDYLLEFKVLGVNITPEVGLTGVLDKVEILPGGEVRVVDYKTGKPKSRNHIEGKTKNSNGNFKRQLVFYKLLLDNYDHGKYQMSQGRIDFVEPDSQTGKYRQEDFIITDAEVRELTEIIKGAVSDITALGFWNRSCDNPECPYCRLREGLA